MTLLHLLDVAGICVFAASGALAAGRKRMDGFGVVVLAVVTAAGGGTVRDLILDLPVFWVETPAHLVAAVVAALLTMGTARWWLGRAEALLLRLDAAGLGLFAAVGTAKAVDAGVDPGVALAMGVLTGCGGGILRDLLAGEIPYVFRGELYATAALIGSGLYLILLSRGVPAPFALAAAAIACLVVRLAALRWDLRLPVFKLPPPA